MHACALHGPNVLLCMMCWAWAWTSVMHACAWQGPVYALHVLAVYMCMHACVGHGASYVLGMDNVYTCVYGASMMCVCVWHVFMHACVFVLVG
jgi:hypothetical protein